jgi:hypothetical protein
MGWRIFAVLAAIMGVTATGAGAATFCVPAHAGCTGTAEPTLAAAITAANAMPDSDDIVLGAGSFVGGPVSGPEVHIRGAGRDVTFIEDGSGSYGVYLGHANSTISDLTIHEPSGGPSVGLYLSGRAQNVTVDQRDNAAGANTAVSLHGDGAFEDGAALAPVDVMTAINGISASSTGTMLVSNSDVQGSYGIRTTGTGSATVRFARVKGSIYGIYAGASNTLVDDSVVSGGRLVAATGIGTGADVVATVRHVTIDGSYLGAEGANDSYAARMFISNSAVVGGGTDPETPDVFVSAYGAATAEVHSDYSFYRGAHALKGMHGGTETLALGTHDIDGADAKLVNRAAGDLRLTVASPLVDAGDPVPGGGEPQADIAGELRAVNGRADIGAYEYGRHAPTLGAGAAPSAVLIGAEVKFTAGSTDADPGEVPVLTWLFDDGATAAGSPVSHAFTTAGVHTATATATDPAGLAVSTNVAVTVVAPAPPPGPARTAMAPALRFHRLSAHEGTVRVALSCPLFATRCTGRLDIRLSHTRVVLGTVRYSIAHGTIRTVKVKLNKAARRRLRHARHGLRVKVVVRPTGAAGTSKTVTLRRR